MEELARDVTIRLNSPAYRAGLHQFESNLNVVLTRLASARVPVFVGSLASNLRDVPPFGSDSGTVAVNARAAYHAARAELPRNVDSARTLFVKARDLDLVKFRAPTAMNAVIRRLAAADGATYVPIDEALAAAAPDGIPGNETFFEHVHPRPQAAALMARRYLEAMQANPVLGARLRAHPIRPWPEYVDRMRLTALDDAIADISIGVVTGRWPFVPPERSTDYLARYVPHTAADSAAVWWMMGRASWNAVKLGLAQLYERRQQYAAAAAEYAGLMRDQPWDEQFPRSMGHALIAAGRETEGRAYLLRAQAIRPTATGAYYLGLSFATDDSTLANATRYFEQALAMTQTAAPVLYQLARVYQRRGMLAQARGVARRLAAIAPTDTAVTHLLHDLQLSTP